MDPRDDLYRRAAGQPPELREAMKTLSEPKHTKLKQPTDPMVQAIARVATILVIVSLTALVICTSLWLCISMYRAVS